MIPILAIVGYSNAGKTTLTEKLIKELTLRGYKVATVKHHHKDIEFDRPGKDTWRHARAGAETVILASPHKLVKISRTPDEVQLADAIKEISGVDIILVEGFKKAKLPKIEVFRSSVHNELITDRDELLAVAADVEFKGIPSYGLDDAKGLIDLVVKTFLKPNP